MRAHRQNISDDELRALLRRHDPAADGSEPWANELAAMRRAILQQAAERRASWFGLSWTAIGAAAAVAGAVFAVALLLRLGPGAMTSGPQADRLSAEAGEESGTTPVAPSGGAGEEARADNESGQRAAPEGGAIEEPARERAATAAGHPRPGRQARTVRFTAPRGTRIIWTLDPDFKAPTLEPRNQARQGR
ncbi:MAG: hypothetical protein ACE5HV_08080 [Acidobacteriota bacterium]